MSIIVNWFVKFYKRFEKKSVVCPKCTHEFLPKKTTPKPETISACVDCTSTWIQQYSPTQYRCLCCGEVMEVSDGDN